MVENPTQYNVEKVTAFITRPSSDGFELLLLEHPFAGIQIPAGTVEPGEATEDAVLREAAEETGLKGLTIAAYLGRREEKLPDGQAIIARPTRVRARPDQISFDWARLPRGVTVAVEQRGSGYTQVTYCEPDRLPDPSYITYQITGWVPDQALANVKHRYFYKLLCHNPTRTRWTVEMDGHQLALYWSSLDALPAIVSPQDGWLDMLPAERST